MTAEPPTCSGCGVRTDTPCVIHVINCPAPDITMEYPDVSELFPQRPRTLTILIGNSDDKLSQRRWATYTASVDHEIRRFAQAVHFVGFTPPNVRWQTACWVIEADPTKALTIGTLEERLECLAGAYGQDSIALVEGTTRLVKPIPPSPPVTT